MSNVCLFLRVLGQKMYMRKYVSVSGTVILNGSFLQQNNLLKATKTLLQHLWTVQKI